ncbi:MAG: nicotinate (nicotinamide) nucleotide adenylyltransferase [Spirochaetales bacterium]|nr:nicotinate (nicotinamide) nucleotide adenylyltransferase [Spirochaetales bacterium]
MAAGKKVAILGGAFNPVTLGHIQICDFVLRSLKDVNEIWLMPCYRHMYHKDMAPARHRLAMCKLVSRDYPNIKTSDYEIKNRIDAGTYDVIKKLISEYGKNIRFHLIIGQDNANTFHHWVNYRLLEKLIPFIVIPRQGVKPDPAVDWHLKPPHVFLDAENPVMDVSSTLVRTLVKKGKDEEINRYVDTRVASYIKKNKIYQ